jgi:hypothetical protein
VYIGNTLHAALGVPNGVIVLYKAAGWFKGLVNPIVTAAKASMFGPIQWLVCLVGSIAGPALTRVAQGAAERFLVAANNNWMEANSVINMTKTFEGSIAYCNHYKNCSPIPYSIKYVRKVVKNIM